MGRKSKAGNRQLYNKKWIAMKRKRTKLGTTSKNNDRDICRPSEDSEDNMQSHMHATVECTPSTLNAQITHEDNFKSEDRNSPMHIVGVV